SFRSAVLMTDVLHTVESRIDFPEGENGKVHLENLEIASPSGCTMLKERHVEIKSGERVLIIGDSGDGKTLLFRTLAGLWLWGDGKISWPKDEAVLHMPRTPYLPPGTLREVMAYPSLVEGFKPDDFAAALKSVGLDHLQGKLDMQKRWDKKLSDDEQ